jgi:hypothetical protein
MHADDGLFLQGGKVHLVEMNEIDHYKMLWLNK